LHVTLFVLTALSTTLVGAGHYAGYLSDFGRQPVTMAFPEIVLHGFWYSGTILFILGAHEFGHYLACRYYQVDASLPFFIPLPLPPTGTMGAVIKIREPFPNKVVLFDVGVAGPLAGFAVALPALFLGVAMSPVTRLPSSLQGGLELGEPLLFQAAAWLIWGSIADGYSLNLHPLAFAAWFGLIATSFNLFPFSQLDGGHISYAVLGPRSTAVTIGSVVVAVGLAFISSNWVVWTVLMVAVMVVMGPRHPRTLDEDTPLDRPRLWLALLAVVIFALCFTPNPMEPTDLFASR
jgi:membrane-associated protease RseP (regulator of RpoE activity)